MKVALRFFIYPYKHFSHIAVMFSVLLIHEVSFARDTLGTSNIPIVNFVVSVGHISGHMLPNERTGVSQVSLVK